tara:strand:+ start:465 stop:1538 length:1074 start_codon:yes stop_codon:yes gene_type:complete
MRATQFLNEYQDPAQAKQEILSTVGSYDPNDEAQAKLIDRVYSIVQKSGVVDRFLPVVNSKLQGEYNDAAIKTIAEKIVASDRLNIQQKNDFLDLLQANKCVNTNTFLTDGHYSISQIFNGPLVEQMFLEFMDFGAGQQRAGKGEHALAILSTDISQKGTGDIDVNGTPVELKVASSAKVGAGSGRMGEGGVSKERVLAVLNKFPEFEQPLGGYFNTPGSRGTPPKTMNLKMFVDMCNKIEFGQGRRKAVGDAIFGQVFDKMAGPIVQAFDNPNANADAVLDAYIAANFDWYKANPDMGGSWQIMCSLAIGAASMITCSSGKSLNQLRKSGALYSGIPSLIPSQAPEVFFQPNPTRK